MDVVGYCTIKKDATTGVGSKVETFLGKDVRVMEFTPEGDVLVVNSEATAMAMFDACDVVRKFECSFKWRCYLSAWLKFNRTNGILYKSYHA